MYYVQSSACHVVSTQIFIIITNILFRRFKASKKKLKETILLPYKKKIFSYTYSKWKKPSQVVITFPSIEVFNPMFHKPLAE